MGRAGDVAMPAIEEFLQAAPGIPWSAQTFDDLLSDLKQRRSTYSTYDYKNLEFSIHLVVVTFHKKGEEVQMIEGQVNVYFKHEVQMDYDRRSSRRFTAVSKQEPLNRKGLTTVLQEVQKIVNDIKRRGFCEDCLASEPPRKMLRLTKLNKCADCGLNQIYHQ